MYSHVYTKHLEQCLTYSECYLSVRYNFLFSISIMGGKNLTEAIFFLISYCVSYNPLFFRTHDINTCFPILHRMLEL